VPFCNAATILKINKHNSHVSAILFETPVDGIEVQHAQKIFKNGKEEVLTFVHA
jgi:hypothetical protein